MRPSDGASAEKAARFGEAEPGTLNARARRSARARFEAEREKSASVVIVSSLFLVLIAAGLLIGGHAAIDPLLQSAIAARGSNGPGAGEVLYTMPDGIFCRHVSFDNATAEMVEGAIERCADDITRDHAHSVNGFAWGAH